MPSDPDDMQDRRKIFGWLSIENAIQLIVLLVVFAAGYAQTSANVAINARDIAALKIIQTATEKKTDDALMDTRNAITVNAQQQGEISALQQRSDANQKLLTDIAANVAVLLDRTDPRKHP